MEESLIKKSKKSKKKIKIPAVVNEDASSSELVIVDEMAPVAPLTPTPIPSTSGIKSKNTPNSNSTSSANNKKRRKRDSASSDEERWLTAIESGKLEDVDDELKKIKPKDPALMTARQRAMYDRSSTEASGTALMSLPTGYKEKVMTAEAIQKAAIKSQKRKQLADEKREKDKKKTMERLLKKQESKAAKAAAAAKAKVAKTNVPVIIYRQNAQITLLSLPDGVNYPLKAETIKRAPERKLCVCGNLKKYSCSKTGVPLCSLECYKNNLKSIIS